MLEQSSKQSCHRSIQWVSHRSTCCRGGPKCQARCQSAAELVAVCVDAGVAGSLRQGKLPLVPVMWRPANSAVLSWNQLWLVYKDSDSGVASSFQEPSVIDFWCKFQNPQATSSQVEPILQGRIKRKLPGLNKYRAKACRQDYSNKLLTESLNILENKSKFLWTR